jgi:hypothetical protein
VRRGFFRTTAVAAAAALTLAACGEDNDEQALPDDEEAADELEDLDEEALDDMMGEGEDMPDPNDDVEDGIYAGDGVILPVPDGWQLDPQAAAQGAVVAMSEDGQSQLVAQAVDAEEAEAHGPAHGPRHPARGHARAGRPGCRRRRGGRVRRAPSVPTA